MPWSSGVDLQSMMLGDAASLEQLSETLHLERKPSQAGGDIVTQDDSSCQNWFASKTPVLQ